MDKANSAANKVEPDMTQYEVSQFFEEEMNRAKKNGRYENIS